MSAHTPKPADVQIHAQHPVPVEPRTPAPEPVTPPFPTPTPPIPVPSEPDPVPPIPEPPGTPGMPVPEVPPLTAAARSEDRHRLTLAAEGRGIPIIPGALHEADLREYTEEDLLPQLRTLGIG